jgi:hypothetical protein
MISSQKENKRLTAKPGGEMFIVKRKMFDGRYLMIAVFDTFQECGRFILNNEGDFIIV